VAGAPGGPAIPQELLVALPEHDTTLQPTWAVVELGEEKQKWQLLIRNEPAGVDADARGTWMAGRQHRISALSVYYVAPVYSQVCSSRTTRYV